MEQSSVIESPMAITLIGRLGLKSLNTKSACAADSATSINTRSLKQSP